MFPTQEFLLIKDIKKDIIILKNGEWRGVIVCSSVNFGLLSNEEQEAVIYKYQSFLNSLDFSIQILIQSRKLNIGEYLKELKKVEEKQESELLRIQAIEYREFIKSLSEMVNLMSKNFYIIIPFHPGKIFKKIEKEEKEFLRWKSQFDQRVEFIIGGLSSVGIAASVLKEEELLELIWSSYNPSEAEKGEAPAILF